MPIVTAPQQRTPAHREAVRRYLRLYYAGELNKRVNTRHPSATGVELAPRFVTKLDLDRGLAQLARAHNDLYVDVQLRYERDLPQKRIAELLGVASETIGRELGDAIDYLCDVLFGGEE
jgi:DNA-directed RNA polymerase specialized sigma24 family protein